VLVQPQAIGSFLPLLQLLCAKLNKRKTMTMFSSSLARHGSRVAMRSPQSRTMAAFPARMAVKKNIFIEEWNGKREITNLDFVVDFKAAPMVIFYCMILPYGVYTWSRSEFKSRGDRHYKDTV
jgi:hypothetical protein